MKRVIKKEDRERFKKLNDMGCILCFLRETPGTPSEIHHVRTEVGWGRDGHQNTIPLCPYHHRGKLSVHNLGRDEFTAEYGVSEITLLDLTNRMLEK